jgi:hypothetical protein
MDFTALDHLKFRLDAHHVRGNFTPFLEIIAGLMKESFETYLFAPSVKGGGQ